MNWNTPEKQRFIKAILSLKTEGETRHFLRDLMTESEINDFAKRLTTAIMLSEQMPYTDIEKQTGFSSRTIARVSKWLNNGESGYKDVIGKIHHHPLSQIRKGLSL
ncbi:MAG: YerC/YecD family TrpR-related protein [Candidatus Taylorbacteria bacterium]|nr:YerC/YecD family TrpR-related protein [Candidatus Taylorbacteria bacterium]